MLHEHKSSGFGVRRTGLEPQLCRVFALRLAGCLTSDPLMPLPPLMEMGVKIVSVSLNVRFEVAEVLAHSEVTMIATATVTGLSIDRVWKEGRSWSCPWSMS